MDKTIKEVLVAQMSVIERQNNTIGALIDKCVEMESRICMLETINGLREAPDVREEG